MTVTDETTTLLRYLDAQRDSVLAILEGMSDKALGTPVVPSGWTPLGLVRHLCDAEHLWLHHVLAGSPGNPPTVADRRSVQPVHRGSGARRGDRFLPFADGRLEPERPDLRSRRRSGGVTPAARQRRWSGGPFYRPAHDRGDGAARRPPGHRPRADRRPHRTRAAMNVESEYLDSARQHVLGILDGLDEDALRRPVLPSGWNLLGLVRHLTIDVERFWFQAVVAGDQPAIDEVVANIAADGDGGAWTVPAGASAAGILDAYRAAARRSDEIIAAADLAAPPRWWPGDLFGDWRIGSVREVVLHVIVETAGHAGHCDAVRELLDGRQWLVLT